MVVDFHTHILPSIDDGSKNLDESIEMLSLESKMGIKHVVLTPHFYPTEESPETFLRKREKSYSTLNEEVKKYKEFPQLHLGAEVYYFDGIGSWEGLHEFVIQDTNCVLIEMPSSPWTSRMYEELENIANQLGLIPIIAHLDRYITPFKTYDIPKKLSQLPVIVQVNSSFFLKPMTQRFALKLLKQGMIHILGSDCHNLTSRIPNLNQTIEIIEKKLGSETIKIINEYENEIFSNIN